MTSYSEYTGDLSAWYDAHVGETFGALRRRIAVILAEEDRLMEIVRLIGSDVLPDDQKLILETAGVIRRGFLQQDAFHKDDTFVSLDKQKRMMETILHLHDGAARLVATAVPVSQIQKLGLFEKLSRMKYEIPNDRPGMFDEYIQAIDTALSSVE